MRTWLLLASLMAMPAMAAPSQTIVIRHAKALTGTDAIVEDATIVVRDRLIVSVGKDDSTPAGARMVDAAGRFVTPGLMAGVTQLGLVDLRGSPDGTDVRVTSGPLGAQFDVSHALNPNSTALELARADGLTRAMSYPGGSAVPPFTGTGVILRLTDGTDIVDQARSAVFTEIGGFSKGQAGGSRAAQWILLRTALAEAQRKTGALKNQSVVAAGTLAPDANMLEAVAAGRARLVIGTNRASDIRAAVVLAQETGMHVVILGGAEAWQVADRLAAARIPVVLDPMVNEPEDLDSMGARVENAAILQRAGVTIAFVTYGSGVDLTNNVGLALREAAGIAVANGLPYLEAIKAVTVNPARIWGIDARYGTLTAGREADIVIWDGDPLEPASAPVFVMVQGKEVSLQTRQKALRDRYDPRQHSNMPPAYR